MDSNPSAVSSSPSPSHDPIEFVHPTFPPSLSQGTIATPSAQARKELAAQRTERRRVKRKIRLEARSTPLQLVACQHRHLSQGEMKVIESLLLKEYRTKSELKRAKKTGRMDTFPGEFQTINIRNDHDDEITSECEQSVITEAHKIGAESKATRDATFAGLITIQDRLKAMGQALSEHAEDSTLRRTPGRLPFYVDAAVSPENRLTGIAVVHKPDRQELSSPWIANGYRILDALDQVAAEAWAIWQALQVILERVHAENAEARPQDPCSVAVVYSDCKPALRWIKKGIPKGGKVVQKIIAQSIELQRLGVDVHLHWVQGHRGIPGNELADLVAKRARLRIQ